jgi:hypothetical protein
MIITKHTKVDLDLEGWRQELQDPKYGYTSIEQNKLLALYELVENSTMKEAYKLVVNWPPKWRELIPCALYALIWDSAWGGENITYTKEV